MGDDGGRRRLLRERLADLEHQQWIEWSRRLAACERLSAERLARWRSQWVPYAQLSEADKERDRLFADRVLALLDAVAGRDEGEAPTVGGDAFLALVG